MGPSVLLRPIHRTRVPGRVWKEENSTRSQRTGKAGGVYVSLVCLSGRSAGGSRSMSYRCPPQANDSGTPVRLVLRRNPPSASRSTLGASFLRPRLSFQPSSLSDFRLRPLLFRRPPVLPSPPSLDVNPTKTKAYTSPLLVPGPPPPPRKVRLSVGPNPPTVPPLRVSTLVS